MARQPTQTPHSPNPTPAEKRNAIDRLNRRIEDLRKFDPQSVQTRRSPEVVSLEAAIQETLAAIFGSGTDRYNRYRAAASLEPLQSAVYASAGARPRGENIGELRMKIAERKSRAIGLLQSAIQGLEEELEHEAPSEIQASGSPEPSSRKIFVVHGHDNGAREAMARFLEKIGLQAILLQEQPDQGFTIIEKFETYAIQVSFAVVLLTPDDIGGLASASKQAARARQNVVFELGYFVGKLGRGRACLLRKGEVEIPSDLYGVIYSDLDAGEGWKLKLIKELKAAKLEFDANKAWE